MMVLMKKSINIIYFGLYHSLIFHEKLKEMYQCDEYYNNLYQDNLNNHSKDLNFFNHKISCTKINTNILQNII